MCAKDNRGFTLMELAIVIALLVILLIVLAPVFVRYVERGRQSTDRSVAEDLLKIATAMAADTEASAYLENGDVIIFDRMSVRATHRVLEQMRNFLPRRDWSEVRVLSREYMRQEYRITFTTSQDGAIYVSAGWQAAGAGDLDE